MKFEKINKDQVKITFNNEDLVENDIDLHSFMSNSEESQVFFWDVLNRIEKDYGFSTKNYNIKVETIALSDGCFILTITRTLDKSTSQSSNLPRKKVRVMRKSSKEKNNLSVLIYRFNNFDDFCGFAFSFKKSFPISVKKFFKNSVLYTYNEKYYLVISDLSQCFSNCKSFFAFVTEYGYYVDHPIIFSSKLYENGKVIFKDKSFQSVLKYFNK